ncbi:MAG: hypothetical protein WC490_04925 [Candidatus Margulisiibacteriota bacterium]
MTFSPSVNLSAEQASGGLNDHLDNISTRENPFSRFEAEQSKHQEYSKFFARAERFESEAAPAKKEVQTTTSAAASAQQKTSEVKTQAKGEAVYGGMNEDLFIEAKKKDTLYSIKEKTSGDLGGVKSDEEKDPQDEKKKKHDFDFLSDIMALLHRLGVIKKRMRK